MKLLETLKFLIYQESHRPISQPTHLQKTEESKPNSEVYLGTCQVPIMEFFGENS